jgi:pimeloyl-ACP methyl ester carboxylesterase
MAGWGAVWLVLSGCSHAEDAFWVRRDGADLPVWRQGPDEAEIVVLMTHGSGASGRYYDWFEAFDRIEDDVAVVYWDLRGAGNSQGSAGPGGITLDALLADLALVRDAVEERYEPERLVLGGHSLGGGLSIGYLSEPGNREGIAGYVDVSGARNAEQAFDDVRRIMTRTAEEAGRDDIAAFYEDLVQVPQDPVLRRQHAGYVVEVNDLRGFDQAAADADLAAFIAGQGASASVAQGVDVLGLLGNTASFVQAFDFQSMAYEDAELAAIDVPTLFVAGRFDLSVPPDASRRTDAALDDTRDPARFLELEAGHWPMFDEPDAFATAVLDFLDALR